MTRFSGAEFLSVDVSKRREDMSVYNEFLLSPSAFGAAEVTVYFRQLFCMPWRFRTNRDDAVDGWRVFVDDSRDYGVIYVSTRSPVVRGHVAKALRMSLANARFSMDAYFRYRTQHRRGAGLSIRRLHSTAW